MPPYFVLSENYNAQARQVKTDPFRIGVRTVKLHRLEKRLAGCLKRRPLESGRRAASQRWTLPAVYAPRVLDTPALPSPICNPLLCLAHAFLTLAAHSVMDRNDAPAFGTGVLLFLLLHEPLQPVLAHRLAVLREAHSIPFVVAFFKAFYQLAGVVWARKAIGQPFAPDSIFYLAFAAVLRFAHVAVQAAGTRLFVIAVLIADQTVHAAGGKQRCIRHFFWHFHGAFSLSVCGFFHSSIVLRTCKQAAF